MSCGTRVLISNNATTRLSVRRTAEAQLSRQQRWTIEKAKAVACSMHTGSA
jgi:hypothetical protein